MKILCSIVEYSLGFETDTISISNAPESWCSASPCTSTCANKYYISGGYEKHRNGWGATFNTTSIWGKLIILSFWLY